MHILRTRPSGETSAARALTQRGVSSLRPVEIHRRRSRGKNGRRETIDRHVALLPCYLLASPTRPSELDNALADMALREPRRDVQGVIGTASPSSLEPVLQRHGRVIDDSAPGLRIGDIARVTDGPLREFRVRILGLRGGKARVEAGPYRADVPISTLASYDQSRVPIA